jgi:hypothetical protein
VGGSPEGGPQVTLLSSLPWGGTNGDVTGARGVPEWCLVRDAPRARGTPGRCGRSTGVPAPGSQPGCGQDWERTPESGWPSARPRRCSPRRRRCRFHHIGPTVAVSVTPGSSTRRRSALPRYRWLPARWPPRPEEGDQPRPRPRRGCSAVSRQRRSEGPTCVSGGRCGDAAAKVASAPALLFAIAATLPAGMTGVRGLLTSPAESLPIRGGWSGLDPGRRDTLPTMRGGRRAESGARPDPVHHGLLAGVRCEVR